MLLSQAGTKARLVPRRRRAARVETRPSSASRRACPLPRRDAVVPRPGTPSWRSADSPPGDRTLTGRGSSIRSCARGTRKGVRRAMRTFDLLTLEPAPGCVSPPRAASCGPADRSRDALDPISDDLRPPSARARAARPGEARRRAEAELDRCSRAGRPDRGSRRSRLSRRCCARSTIPPPVLYVRGTLVPDEGPRAVAIVGSRAAHARRARPGPRAGARPGRGPALTVVSGLARGIDTAAHEGALDAEGRTVAVLGSGLDRVYPPENARLAAADRGAGRGGVASSRWARGPLPGHFPRRNRVIAGWGRGGGGGGGGGEERRPGHGARSRSTRVGRCWRCRAIRRAQTVGGHATPSSATARRWCATRRTWSRSSGSRPADVATEDRDRRRCAPGALTRDVPASLEELQAPAPAASVQPSCWPSSLALEMEDRGPAPCRAPLYVRN